jgi:hypothetical protein
MKEWNAVVNDVLIRLDFVRAEREQTEDVSRARLSVAALVYLKSDGRPYVMRDADWHAVETAFLLAGYGLVRFGVKHVGIVQIKAVIKWPRVSLLEHLNAEGD